MNVLVACEYSGTVRDAFTRAGHEAMSCDVLPSETPGKHHRGNVVQLIKLHQSAHFLGNQPRWDLIIAHPPCTHMAVCGNGTWAGTAEREDAQSWTAELWRLCLLAAPRVCFENPVSTLSRALPVKAKYVHPWQHGHPETKKTGLWLHGLPELKETNNVYDYMMTLPLKERHKVWYASPGKNRGKERSRFYPGIAKAMAAQWGRDY